MELTVGAIWHASLRSLNLAIYATYQLPVPHRFYFDFEFCNGCMGAISVHFGAGIELAFPQRTRGLRTR